MSVIAVAGGAAAAANPIGLAAVVLIYAGIGLVGYGAKIRSQLKEKADLEQWLLRNRREDQKKALQEDINTIKEIVGAEKEGLNAQLEVAKETYDELTKETNLRAEAEKLMTTNSKRQIDERTESL